MIRILYYIFIIICLFANTEFASCEELTEIDSLSVLIEQLKIDLKDSCSDNYAIFGGTLCPEEGIFESKDKYIPSKTLNSFILLNFIDNNINISDIRLRDGHFEVDCTYLVDDCHISVYLNQIITEIKYSGVNINIFGTSTGEFFLYFFYKNGFYSYETIFPNVSMVYHPNIEKYSVDIHNRIIILELFRFVLKKDSFKDALKFLEIVSMNG